MFILKVVLIIFAVLIGLYLIHRLCLWAELKGWIFYQKTKPSGNALGASALELQNLFEAGKATHVIEAKNSQQPENPNSGPGRPNP